MQHCKRELALLQTSRSLRMRHAERTEPPGLTSRGFGLVERVIGGPDQRTRFHVLEAHLFADMLEFCEFVGVYKTNYGKMLTRGL